MLESIVDDNLGILDAGDKTRSDDCIQPPPVLCNEIATKCQYIFGLCTDSSF